MLNKIIPNSLLLLALTVLAMHKALAAPTLNGLSVHTELGKEQFIAALLVTNLSTSSRDILLSDEPEQIQVRVLADRLSSRSFKRMWIEGMAINASSSELSENAETMANFSNLLKIKLTAGDIFTIDRNRNVVIIYLNSVKLGELNNPAFFDLLLRTWIGPVPLSSQFRDGLLVAGDINGDLLARFDATVPSEERIASVRAAIDSQQERQEPKIASEQPKATLNPVAVAPAITSPGVVATVPVTPPDMAAADKPTQSTPAPTPRPTPKPTPKPTPTPTQVALLDADAVEEEEDDLDFTAESLLQQQLYIANLKRHTYKYLSYPKRALDRGWEGNVRLNITIDRGGKVQNIIVVEESEHKTLTKEAENAAKRASPFPEIPEGLRGDTFAFTLPVVFKIRSE